VQRKGGKPPGGPRTGHQSSKVMICLQGWGDILCYAQYNATHGMSPSSKSVTENLVLELRRGVLVLAILTQLEEEHYGYSLREELAERGLEVPEGTLYPLLRRLETQGLLESRWQLGEGRPRRYYKTAESGRKTLEELSKEWSSLGAALNRVRQGS